MKQPESCLIVEDHQEARRWLSKAVEMAFDIKPMTAATISAAHDQISKTVPELALIDLGLPDGSGRDLITSLANLRHQKNLDTTIVVATVMNDDANVFSAIREGADGYLLKEESQKNLVEMLTGIVDDRPALSPSIAMRLLRHFQTEQNESKLTPRERDVLQLIAKGFTVARVAELLDITYNTTAGYVKEIYRKLEVNNRAEATLEASRRGLV